MRTPQDIEPDGPMKRLWTWASKATRSQILFPVAIVLTVLSVMLVTATIWLTDPGTVLQGRFVAQSVLSILVTCGVWGVYVSAKDKERYRR
jgi:ABC-type uncharacterized transport system permease subunit